MMNMKKLLALLLAIVMVVGMMPMGVLAEETEPSVPETTVALETTVPETTAAAVVTNVEPCTVCNSTECTETHVQCTTCGNWDCETEHKAAEPTNPVTTGPSVPATTDPSVPETTAPTTTPTTPSSPVEKCGICGGEHKADACKVCPFCKVDPCTCVTCGECGVKNDHNSTCSKYLCAECGKNPCVCEADETTEATTEPTETTEVTEESTVTLCEACGQEECVCEMETLYLLKGASIYKDYTDSAETPKVIDKWNTEIKIKNVITTDDGTEWYEFAYTSFWAEFLNEYKFVKAEDTTAFECSCNTEDGEHSIDCDLFEEEIEDEDFTTDTPAVYHDLSEVTVDSIPSANTL